MWISILEKLEMSLLLVLLIIAITMGVHGKYSPCEDSTYYKPNGKSTCKACKRCLAGSEYNTSYARATNENGYLDCYPCVPCQDNHYKEDTNQDGCYMCTLDCNKLNRYSSQPCGRSTQGHCGECKLGYVSISKEPNDICKEITPPQVSRNTSTSKIKEHDEPLPRQPNTGQGNYTVVIVENGPYIIYSSIVIATVPAVVTVVMLTIASCICIWYRKRIINKYRKVDFCCKTASAVHPNSNSALMTLMPNESNNNKSCFVDVELDGPHVEHSSNIGSTALDKFLELDENQRMAMESLQLTNDDKCLSIAAQNVIGEKRFELFRYLNIDEAIHVPEQELWENHKQTHPEYIFKVLTRWISIADKGANLYTLCSSLLQADFGNVAKMLFDLQE